MSRRLYLPVALALAPVLAWSAPEDAAKPKKNGGKPKDGSQPAFVADPALEAFDPAKVKPEHLDAAMFHAPEGLEVTLWAASPMLFNPANMDVDAAGRIWVSEGVNYRRHEGRRREGDRIVVLEDTDHDGKADKSHTFVQDKELSCALGVAVFDNVVVVSNTPDIIVYTDVNRDLKFDPAVDKREVLLTGFQQKQHDHSLHSVAAGPDGRWYFSNGNCGAQFTDRSGHQFNIGGAYLKNPWAGEKSYDGHVYVGGFTASMNPDGTDVRILGHGYRNSYEGVKNSLGDMYHNDNDDPPACRVTPLIEGGFLGFFSPDGQRTWQADRRPGQTVPQAEWRQDDPSTIPAGDVYGGGAPTGMAFYENGALGDKWNGLLLSCETGRNVVFGYLPKPDGAGMKLERFNFLTSNTSGRFFGSDFVGGKDNLSNELHILFRPSDVCVGPDGAVYVTDWYDKRTGGHMDLDETCSGAVYRIAPKGFKPVIPAIDLSKTEGQLAALRSPAHNVRFSGFHALKAQGAAVVPALVKFMESESNPYIAERAVWLLAQLGPEGRKAVEARLTSENESERLVALRALRASGADIRSVALSLAEKDASPAILREVSISFRDAAADQGVVQALAHIAKKYDGADRSLLAAWGIGATGKSSAVLAALALGDAEAWTDAQARLVWQLHVKESVPALQQRAASAKLNPAQRKLAVDTLAFIDDASAAQAMVALAKDKQAPFASDVIWWLINRSTNDWAKYAITDQLKTEGILDPDKITLTPVITPEALPAEQGPQLADVVKLKGDAERGATAVQRCYMCHQVNGQGVDFGPGLTGWGATQPTEVIAEAIINPSKDIAHGYEGSTLMTKDGVQIDGLLLADGEYLMIKSLGGQTQLVPRAKLKSKAKLNRSLMMSAAMLGMTPQDVADVIAYLKKDPAVAAQGSK